MNMFLVRSYYKLTKLETDNTPFTKELHRLFIEAFPEMKNKTIQNIIDQRRSIFMNKRLSAETINQVRREVGIEIGMIEDDVNQVEEPNQLQNEPHIVNPMQDEYETNALLYEGMNPCLRPRLPKLIYKQNTKSIISEANEYIKSKVRTETTITELHTIIYISAATVLTLNGQQIKSNNTGKPKTWKPPAWERRIINKVNNLRQDIGILTQFQRENASRKVKNKGIKIINKYRTEENPSITEVLDLLKQHLAALSKRLRRYKKSNNRRQQNLQFETNQRLFYKSIMKEDQETTEPVEKPDTGEVTEYWRSIWEEETTHKRSRWLLQEYNITPNIRTMLNWRITEEDIKVAVKKTLNWKAPGPEKLQNFWLKEFTACHRQLSNCFTNILEDPNSLPSFLTEGITYLLPKTNTPSADPSKYRPITCLPTIYKILTSTIAAKIYEHLKDNNLLDEEQKGCRKESRGCKEQLIIDAIITGHAIKKKDSLYTAFIDYRKAFDSVPHSWLKEVLKIYGIENHIVQFLEHATTMWKTSLLIKDGTNHSRTERINIKKGIFQGDALSPLWFCLALKPLTSLLNKENKGYIINGKQVSHLYYMDDIKLFAGKEEHLHKILDCVGRFSNEVQMKFGLDKCKISSMKKGKWTKHVGYNVRNQGFISGMNKDETYKYLGYLQTQGILHKEAKEHVTSTYTKRVKAILKTNLSARNITKAINSYATSVLSYSFGIIKWTETELQALDTTTRREFRKHRGHHPHSSVQRIHLPRKYGGRGIPSAVTAHYKQVDNLRSYFLTKADNSNLHLTIVRADKNITPIRLADETYDPKKQIPQIEDLKRAWKGKVMHGKYITRIEDEENIDAKASQAWLTHGNIFNETEGFIAAIQDMVVPTRSYRKRIMKQKLQDTKCRMCAKTEEKLEHITSGCSVMAHKQYLDRHNDVAAILHIELRRKYMNLEENIQYYNYTPPAICENEEVRLYWNRKIITDRTITSNIPDIMLIQKQNKEAYIIIDIAIPWPTNLDKQHSDKINKYLPLADEIKDMWHMDMVTIVPIIIGVNGEIPKRIHASLSKLQLNKNLYIPMQKAALLGTCRIVRRVIGDGANKESPQKSNEDQAPESEDEIPLGVADEQGDSGSET